VPLREALRQPACIAELLQLTLPVEVLEPDQHVEGGVGKDLDFHDVIVGPGPVDLLRRNSYSPCLSG